MNSGACGGVWWRRVGRGVEVSFVAFHVEPHGHAQACIHDAVCPFVDERYIVEWRFFMEWQHAQQYDCNGYYGCEFVMFYFSHVL